jgi:3D (Asp-Asp-Asp) domain-containing protein
VLAILSLLVVVAVPVLLALVGSGNGASQEPAPETKLASATSPVTEASSTVQRSNDRFQADLAKFQATTTTAPPTLPPTTAPPVTAPPVTEPPAPPVTEPPAPEPAPEPAPAPDPEPQGTGNTMTVSSTAYCGGGTTASGESAHEGGVAMNAAPLGTTWRVVGSGATYTVNDRIGSGSDFDIYFSDCGAAEAYGRQTITIEQVG